MTPFAARCFLVGSAMALTCAGVVAPVSGASRSVVLAAAACCAVLDVALARSTRGSVRFVDQAVLGAPPVLADAAVQTEPDAQVLRLGTSEDGGAVEVSTADGVHLVVVGSGVLATAVFRALGVQLRDTAVRTGADVRAASAPDLRDDEPSAGVPTVDDGPHDLPGGCATIVIDPAGPAPASLVLVPGPSHQPRRWDVAIDVTRYGCAVRRPGEPRTAPISPALPLLGAPS